MKRYYLCPVVPGDPAAPPGLMRGNHAKLAEYAGLSVVAVIPTHPEGHPDAGGPVFPWCLCLVSAASHSAALADVAVKALPDFPLDGRMSAMGSEAQGQAYAALVHFGIDTALLAPSSKSYREVIRGIGRALEPAFDESSFDVD